jgi:hypothetical protein
MLTVKVKGREMFDEATMSFSVTKDCELHLEHSLISISKWESKWHKPFLSNKDQVTTTELLDYIKCMTLDKNVDPKVYVALANDVDAIKSINDYIQDPMTATWFSDKKKGRDSEVITSELVYYWMTAYNIPFECEKWHINRLITLIRVCSEKNNPDKKKMGLNETMSQNRALNEARKKALHTKG